MSIDIRKLIDLSGLGGSLIPDTDDAYDIGESSTPLRWKDLFLAGDVTAAGNLTLTGAASELIVDTTTLVVNASGYADRVGIGTTTPGAKLSVTGAVAQKIAEFKGDDASHNRICVCGPIDADSQLSFMHSGSPAWSIGNNADNEAFMIRTGTGAFGTNDKFTILSNGNVGIGTVTPNDNLHIFTTDTGNQDMLSLEAAYENVHLGPALKFIRAGSVLARIRGIEEGSWDGGLTFEVFDLNGGSVGRDSATNEAMRIDQYGNVGIGTTDPQAELDVAGDIIADSILADAGVSGILTLGGTGGTNNENITLDCEAVSNHIDIRSSSGVTRLRNFLFLRQEDGLNIEFGSSGIDAAMGWETTNNDSLQLGLGVGSVDKTGYFSLMEVADLGNANRSPLATSPNPVLRVYSSDATVATDYIEMFHDQNNAKIIVGQGNLGLQSGNLSVDVNDGGSFLVRVAFISMYRITPDRTNDELKISLFDDSGNQINITNSANVSSDHDHDTTPDPTMFINSDLAPDTSNNQWGSLHHDKQNYVVTTGAQIGAGTGVAQACTATNATNLFTDVGHILSDDDRIMIGGDAVPTGIDDTVIYYVISDTTDTFQVSLTSGGGAVTFSDDGTNVTWSYASENAIVFAPRGTEQVRINGSGNVGINTATPDTKLQVVGDVKIGDDNTNYLSVSNTGVVTMTGSAKRLLNLRPDLDYSKVTAQGKPTQVVYGAFLGYSLPLYAADEELFLSMNTPGRWDGASDVVIHLLVALSGAEDVNDDFNLQISWEHADLGEKIENTTHDVEVETNLVAGRVEAYDTYQVEFILDYDVDTPDILEPHDLIAMRLRRIAVAGTEIAGEVIVLDYHMEFQVDKMFGAP